MATVIEETQHEYTGVSLCVCQRDAGETIDPWRIIMIETDGFDRCSPRELRDLGRFLVRESKRIGRAYKSNGAPREPKQEAENAG